jgi:hypothetical protein
LAPIFREAWFWSVLGSRLSFRALTEDEAVRVLADEVKAGPAWRANLVVLLEMLVVVGLVTREADGSIKRVAHVEPPARTQNEAEKTEKTDPPPKESVIANSMSITMQLCIPMDRIALLGSPEKVKSFFLEWANLVNAKASIEKMVSGETT